MRPSDSFLNILKLRNNFLSFLLSLSIKKKKKSLNKIQNYYTFPRVAKLSIAYYYHSAQGENNSRKMLNYGYIPSISRERKNTSAQVSNRYITLFLLGQKV